MKKIKKNMEFLENSHVNMENKIVTSSGPTMRLSRSLKRSDDKDLAGV